MKQYFYLILILIMILSTLVNAQIPSQSGLSGGGRLSPNVYSGNVTLYDDIQLICGSSADAAIEWDTAQTADHLAIGVSGSNRAMFSELADMSTNWGLASATHPEWCVHSADAADVNDWACIAHDTTDTVLTTGTGGFDIQGTIKNDGAGNSGIVLVEDSFRANGDIALTTAATQKFCFQTDCTKYINMTSWVQNGNNTTFAPTANNHQYYFYADALADATERIFMTIGGAQNLGTTATSKLLSLVDNSVEVVGVRHDGLIQSDTGFQPVTVTNVTPAEPYDCVVGVTGVIIHVNDSNDTLESFLCFCGVDADDASYEWFRVASPATNCF